MQMIRMVILMNDYDVGKIFQEIEIELIKSMKRNLGRHLKWEEDEGFNWDQWQAKKIREIRRFRNQNKEIMDGYSQQLSKVIKQDLKNQFLEGGRKVDKEVSKVIEKGYSLVKRSPNNDFFQGDNDKLKRLIHAIDKDLKEAPHAALRQMDDVYRKTIFKTEVYLGSGAVTIDKAIDMATKDFLTAGINCITYANGRNVNIASYARMAVRTGNKRVFLMGEGERRKEWGLSLVLVSQYMQSSPTCLPWQGKVYIDDVYSGGKADDGDYPLLSQAIEGGLFHPNCRHTMSTFFEGVNEKPEPMKKSEVGKAYEKAQKEAEINRNIQKYKRLKEGSLDQQNIVKYESKLKDWQEKGRSFYAGEGMDIKKQSNLLTDHKQYDRYKGILGDDYFPNSFDSFQSKKYAANNEYGILKAQVKGMSYYNKAIANEPEITEHVKKVAKTAGMDSLGLEYRIKSKESFLEKIEKNYNSDGNEYEVKDIIRYTLGSDTNNLVDKTLHAIDMFENDGYNTIRIKNTWEPGSSYNGINTSIKCPNGQIFEMQYHTKESFDLKNGELHKLYEQQRKIVDDESDEYLEIEDKMIELSSKLTFPKNIERVKNK